MAVQQSRIDNVPVLIESKTTAYVKVLIQLPKLKVDRSFLEKINQCSLTKMP